MKWIIAKNANQDRPQENRRAVGSAVLVWMMFLPVTVIVSAVIIYLMPQLIHGAVLDATQLRLVGGLLALNLVLVPLLGIPDAVLVGVNRGYASMLVQTCTLVAANIGMVLVAIKGFGLLAMALVVLVATAVNAFLVFIRARGLVDWFGIAKPERGKTRLFFSFSGWVLVWSLVSKLLLSTDIILLGALVGTAAVADYAFTSYAPQFAIAICFMTGSAAMPGIGALMSGTDNSKLVSAINTCRGVVLLLAVVMCSGILLFNRIFVEIWAGHQHYLGGMANFMMVLAAFQLILIRNESQIQDLTLSIRSKVLLGVVFSLASVGTGIGFYHVSGRQLPAIFAGIILARLALTILFPLMVNRVDPGLSRDWGKVVLAVVIILAVGWLSVAAERVPILWMFLLASVVFMMVVWIASNYLLEAQVRQVAKGLIFSRIRKN